MLELSDGCPAKMKLVASPHMFLQCNPWTGLVFASSHFAGK
jgi:hypothetical protein